MSKTQNNSHADSAERVMVGARVPKAFRTEVAKVAQATQRPMSQILEWAMMAGLEAAKNKATGVEV